ncbi:metalloregulator ArsR/SmtB family transcription factor [Gelria sp. Kuro-4]|uniref:ArsR/SmtB family transcription factor n=1 Tax=Gelria sp. Kuro-4 TaxID=2796927 RepID=UPI001BEDF883|nr:metalloregulator ArsR/SmtB family transcription factor [Gelria sp. Kuro-4]BCV25835.1 transcriptional regulator [Gelria sp. Kuro-4]
MPAARNAERMMADLFKALAHPTRLKILELLKGGELCVCELIPRLGLEQSNVSQHLAVLRREGLVSSYKDGLRVIYRVEHPEVFDLLNSAAKVLVRQVEAGQDVLAELSGADGELSAEAGRSGGTA